MARLPSAADLSGPVSLRSGRMYASADETAAGRGLASLGQDISAIAVEKRNQENAVDIARAEAFKTQGLIDTQNEFDNDPDYSTYSKRAPAKTGDVVKNASDLIRDPEMRERWRLGAQNDAARVNDNIYDRGNTLRRQSETVAFDDALETNRRIYVDPDSSDEARAKAKKDIDGAIKTGQATGLLTPEQADTRRKQYVEDAEFSRGKLAVDRDPNIIARPLPKAAADRAAVAMGFYQSRGYTKEQAAGIVGNLLAESNLDPSGAVGDSGSAFGIAQWRGERLNKLKRFASANGKDWRDFGTQLAFVDAELKDDEPAAYAALKKATNVDEATAAFIGFERPQGWTPDNPRGGHNYKGRLTFAAQAAGQDVNPDWYKAISPEQRAVIDHEAETRRNQIAAETRGNLDIIQQNAPAAVQNTGTYSGSLPSAEDFFQAYGPQDGAQKYSAFQAAMETSRNVYDMRTMSSADIESMVKGAVPKSSGDSAALETKRYEALSTAADAVLKSRAADPAAYVRQAFPSVDAAWNDVADGAGYQAAVGASIAAQKQLGITDIKPLPKTVAADAITAFKDEAKPEGDRIGAISNVLMATPDPAQRRAIFDQLVKAGLPDTTEGAIEAMARGDAGASQRLWTAALTDTSKLPGQIPGGLKPSDIDAAIQSDIMDQGQIGDIYYGLTNGSSDNYLRAQRDSKLLNNAVNLRLRNGETLDAAVAGAAKDLYGDVKAVNAGNAQILLPTDADPVPVLSGLTGQIPEVEKALKAAIPPLQGGKASDGGKAIIDAVTENHISSILSEGFFRNSADGYVFIDPFSGNAVAGGDGKPIIFHPTPVDPKAAYENVSPVDILSGNDPVFGAR